MELPGGWEFRGRPWNTRSRVCGLINTAIGLLLPSSPRNNMKFQSSVLLFFCILLLDACQRGISKPSIEFSKIPLATVGGLDNMDTIEGSVTGVRPGQRVVLYAKSQDR